MAVFWGSLWSCGDSPGAYSGSGRPQGSDVPCDTNNDSGCDPDDGGPCSGPDDCPSRVCVNGACLAECTDGVMNGDESGVDCGGSVCGPCPTGEGCIGDPDCADGVCDSGQCAEPSCSDGLRNGFETDVDCGGGECPGCAQGECLFDDDCQSLVCTNNRCTHDCNDGVRNGAETGTDCGGGHCPTCDDEEACIVATDCRDRVCIDTVCEGGSCSDGVQNGDETGVDCGGSCPPCHCFNHIQDVDETGIDCGGSCPPCHCDNGTQDGDETGVDCGGSCPLCQCENGVRDTDELGIDCGGPCPRCSHCDNGIQDADETGVDCGGLVCNCCSCPDVPHCLNGVRDGDEMGIDCGGSCPGCGHCDNGIQDGDETGVDCGGSCPTCPCFNGIQDNDEAEIDCGGMCPRCGHCDNEIRDGDETGVDCGGSCPRCEHCYNDVRDGDETGVDCGGSCPACMHCLNGVQDSDETGVDCGGSECIACPCFNGIQDGDETGIDCGGPDCDTCATCDDGVINGNETGLDCGGPDCSCCADVYSCSEAADCCSGSCVRGVCLSRCTDGIQNGDETGLDCGGPDCGCCFDSYSCSGVSDCCNGSCLDGVCLSSCTDGIQNGNETGVDCGGPDCSCCTDSYSCSGASDCCSWSCQGGVCLSSCSDGVQNGDETGVDCGGECPDCDSVTCEPGTTWLQIDGGVSTDNAVAVELDYYGNRYVAGYYSWPQDGAAVTIGGREVTSHQLAGRELYVAKYGPTGRLIWVTTLSPESPTMGERVEPTGIAVDGWRSVYVVGTYQGRLTIGSSNLDSGELDEIFVARLGHRGIWTWGLSSTTTDPYDSSNPFVTATPNLILGGTRLYVAGEFHGQLELGGRTVLSGHDELSGATGGFVGAIHPDGYTFWLSSFTTQQYDHYVLVHDLAWHGSDLYLVGDFRGKVRFGGVTAFELNSSGDATSWDGFVAKMGGAFMATGGAFTWARPLGAGFASETASSIAVSAPEQIWVTGTYDDDTTMESLVLPHTGETDVYIAELQADGQAIGVTTFGSAAADAAGLLVSAPGGGLYATASLGGPASIGDSLAVEDGLMLAALDESGAVVWAASPDANGVVGIMDLLGAGGAQLVAVGQAGWATTGGSVSLFGSSAPLMASGDAMLWNPLLCGVENR